MKRKIKRVQSAPRLLDRLAGIARFRITGPSLATGKRRTILFTGTRKQAELEPLP